MRFSPGRLKLSGPLAGQLTLQRPPLLVSQIGYRDLEHDSLLAALPAGHEGKWQSRSQKGTDLPNWFYVLAPIAFESRDRVAEFRRPNDHETELWRACQRFSTYMDRISTTV